MIGSTMRAAPSTMSSGGWKRCSAAFCSAMSSRVLVAHPAGVDAVHVDPVGVVVGRRGARHHVQRGLGHVRVRVPRGLEVPVELALDGRDVDDVLVAARRAEHERLQAGVEDERRDRVHELRLEQLDRRDLVEEEPPRVALAEVDLLADPGRAGPRGRGRPAPARSSGSSGSCESSAARVIPTSGSCSRPAGRRSERAQALVLAEQAARGSGQGCAPRPSPPRACAGRSRAAGARSGRRC